ncbi:hypothetical protein DSO57_1023680 [Entomophthora muscae]|uniref:Uncharacterized protein n=1 Tax=Entomophthora muscae TaxID=34485 RepID=A0ACC2T317_9FUNG|nr:hypothetical protein DSO57_1023680 [Entomophthora muscae]
MTEEWATIPSLVVFDTEFSMIIISPELNTSPWSPPSSLPPSPAFPSKVSPISAGFLATHLPLPINLCHVLAKRLTISFLNVWVA